MVKLNRYIIRLAKELSRKRVACAAIFHFLYYFDWLFFSGIFIKQIVYFLENGFSFQEIMWFIAGTVCVFSLVGMFNSWYENCVKPETDIDIYQGLYERIYAKAQNASLSCFEDTKFYDFYKMWLDETMSYSCGYFKNENDTLYQAQCNKVDRILEKLNLSDGMTLCDIGCGWGFLLIEAAKKYNIKGVGITLSREQKAKFEQRIKEENLSDRLEVKLLDYRDLPKQHMEFDRVVSVGMIEHVGRGNYEEFMQCVKSVLKQGGVFVLHFISALKEYLDPYKYLPQSVCTAKKAAVDSIEAVLDGKTYNIDMSKDNDSVTAFFNKLSGIVSSSHSIEAENVQPNDSSFVITYHFKDSAYADITVYYTPYDNDYYTASCGEVSGRLVNKRSIESVIDLLKAVEQ